MDNLRYIIYDNISKKAYIKLENRFNALCIEMTKLMESSKFFVSGHGYMDSISIGWTCRDKEFEGGIGISFDDLPEKYTFSLHIIASYDLENHRYSKKINLVENFTLEELKINYIEWLSNAIKIYNSWSKMDLTDKDLLSGY